MEYRKVVKAVFKRRPNRFVAYADINGREEAVHVKNTGRCKELLIEGCTIYLAEADNQNRKTRYDLVAVEKIRGNKPPLLINMDSQIPNSAAEEWLKRGVLFSENAVIKREVTYGSSRFDFYIEDCGRRIFLEVKGVTLENDGTAMFPDAPTERGVKHINELIKCIDDGFEAYILFVIQMKEISGFRPNDKMHPEFGEALRNAEKAGVKIIAMDCAVTFRGIEIDSPIKVIL